MAVGPEIVAAVARRLAEHAGLELPAWVIEARVSQRVAALDVEPSSYVALIGSARGESELDELIETVRVGESRLFRHRSQITALIDTVIPIWRASGRKSFRIWSAGCAAGEEPYTLAAVLAAELPGAAISIIAHDVSSDAVEAARSGTYPVAAWNEIPDEWRDAFELRGDRVHVVPDIAAMVRFERGNLADPRLSAPRGCDLVWCRNVLIYFTPAARRRVIDRLVGATLPGGFVFVGYSESLRDVVELDAVRAGEAVYYVRRDGPPRRPSDPPPSRATPAMGIAIPRTKTPGVLVVHGVTRTPPADLVVVAKPVGENILALRGQPDSREVTAELTTRLAIVGLERLVIDLDGTTMIDDTLAPILRRARAAALAAGVELALHATKTGARRWLSRHDLDGDSR